MPTGLRRIAGFGHLHFITFCCYQRRALLGSVRARNVTVQILREVRARYGFALIGYVIMPEHMHLLISEMRSGHAGEGHSGAQAKSFAADAREKTRAERADGLGVSGGSRWTAAILAAAVF